MEYRRVPLGGIVRQLPGTIYWRKIRVGSSGDPNAVLMTKHSESCPIGYVSRLDGETDVEWPVPEDKEVEVRTGAVNHLLTISKNLGVGEPCPRERALPVESL